MFMYWVIRISASNKDDAHFTNLNVETETLTFNTLFTLYPFDGFSNAQLISNVIDYPEHNMQSKVISTDTSATF